MMRTIRDRQLPNLTEPVREYLVKSLRVEMSICPGSEMSGGGGVKIEQEPGLDGRHVTGHSHPLTEGYVGTWVHHQLLVVVSVRVRRSSPSK